MGANTKLERVSEGVRRQWAADRALRPPMRSPGRPEPPRAVQREFWQLTATGITTVEAALHVGVSWPVGARWFRHAGGMPPISLDEPSGRYLSFAAGRYPFRPVIDQAGCGGIQGLPIRASRMASRGWMAWWRAVVR